jgi:hypothetical protein
MSGAGAPRHSRIFHDLISAQGVIVIGSGSAGANPPVTYEDDAAFVTKFWLGNWTPGPTHFPVLV